jgi:hypothetical protein
MEENDIVSEEMIKASRARQMVLAILYKAKEAGIPDKFMRINEDTFSKLLSPEYHGKSEGVKEFAHSLYNDPEILLNRDFITIDGGNYEARKMAGFAILFRMIAYDKSGMYKDCNWLINKLQTINSMEGMTRNNITEELKPYGVLYVGEFLKKGFSPHFETGRFFDEIFTERIDNSLPTIISFVDPISNKSMSEKADDGDLNMDCGRYLASLSVTGMTTNKVLRIRVKNI